MAIIFTAAAKKLRNAKSQQTRPALKNKAANASGNPDNPDKQGRPRLASRTKAHDDKESALQTTGQASKSRPNGTTKEGFE